MSSKESMIDPLRHAHFTLDGWAPPRRYYWQGPPIDGEAGWLCSSVVGYEHCATGFVGFHTIQEGFTPGFRGRHIHQVLDVNGGNNGMASAELLAGLSLDTNTSPSLQDQPAHRPVREKGSTVIFDDAAQGLRKPSGAAFRNSPATALSPSNERVGEQPGAGSIGGLQCPLCEPQHP